MVYIVLGMHKSGTTLVSRILHESGIVMGSDADCSGDYDNKGFYENAEIVALNSQIIKSSVILPMLRHWIYRRWKKIDKRPNALSIVLNLPSKLTSMQKTEMQQLIKRYNLEYPNWGFKDPMSCLTYHLWARELPPHKLIVIFRSYNELFKRYEVDSKKRFDLPMMYTILHAWITYNKASLQAIKTSPNPFIVIRYENLMRDDEEFNRLQQFVGKPLVDQRNPAKYRNRAYLSPKKPATIVRLMTPFLPHDPNLVFEELQQLAEQP